jgi:hypothetical protein
MPNTNTVQAANVLKKIITFTFNNLSQLLYQALNVPEMKSVRISPNFHEQSWDFVGSPNILLQNHFSRQKE